MHFSTIRPVSLLRRFRDAQTGSVLILVAVGLGAIMSVTGMVFEISNYASAKSRFNNAVDQALLAAAAAHSADPTGYATEYLKTNLNESAKNVVLESFSVTKGNSDTLWHASAKGSLKTTIAGMIGISEFSLSHDATVVWDTRTVSEIVAMVDVSGTMCAHFQRSSDQNGKSVVDFVPDRTCKKLSMMKEGLNQIANIGIGYNPDGTQTIAYKVGIVPFTYKMRVPNPDKVPAFMYKGEQDAGYGTNYFTDLSDAEGQAGPLPPVSPLRAIANQADKEALLNDIEKVTTGNNEEFNRPAWKRSALAAEMAGLMLDPGNTKIFGGEKPAEFGAKNSKKIVIMMTDSANMGCCFTNYPVDNFRGHYIYSYSQDHKHLVGDGKNPGVCKQMKDAGIEIFTVLLDVNPNDMDAGGQDIVDAFQKKCATDESHAFIVGGDDDQQQKQLENAYTTIGKALIKLRLSE